MTYRTPTTYLEQASAKTNSEVIMKKDHVIILTLLFITFIYVS